MFTYMTGRTEQRSIRRMASLKAVKPAGLAKEPAAKLSETATKPAAAKGGVKKAEQKPREPKKKVKSSKPAAAKN